jgi:hypothetical protein
MAKYAHILVCLCHHIQTLGGQVSSMACRAIGLANVTSLIYIKAGCSRKIKGRIEEEVKII